MKCLLVGLLLLFSHLQNPTATVVPQRFHSPAHPNTHNPFLVAEANQALDFLQAQAPDWSVYSTTNKYHAFYKQYPDASMELIGAMFAQANKRDLDASAHAALSALWDVKRQIAQASFPRPTK
jgi:hypothetical protein